MKKKKKKGVSVAINTLINTLLLSNGPGRRADGAVAAGGKTSLVSKLETLKGKNHKERECLANVLRGKSLRY